MAIRPRNTESQTWVTKPSIHPTSILPFVAGTERATSTIRSSSLTMHGFAANRVMRIVQA